MLNRYLNQCRLLVNWNLGNKLQRCLHQNSRNEIRQLRLKPLNSRGVEACVGHDPCRIPGQRPCSMPGQRPCGIPRQCPRGGAQHFTGEGHLLEQGVSHNNPDSNEGWANVGPTSGRQYRSWANVGPTCIAVCEVTGTQGAHDAITTALLRQSGVVFT